MLDGSNLEARCTMSAASLLAGMSLCQTGGGLAHALAETIQIPYRIPHGTAISVVLPHVMNFNLQANPGKYANIAKAMGVVAEGQSEMDLARRSVAQTHDMIERLGLAQKLSQLGIPSKELKTIARWTVEQAPSLLKVNPRIPTEQDLIRILENAY